MQSAPAPGSVRAPLFNLAEIQRGELASLYVEFYAGDILSVYSDALIVSAFSGDYYPISGSVLGAIADRFGIRYGANRPDGTVSIAGNLHRFPTPRCSAFKELWVLEIKNTANREPVSPGEIALAFSTLHHNIRQLVENGISSISMPLFGTGDIDLPVGEVVDQTIDLLRGWANAAPSLRTVRIFAHDLGKVATLNLAINKRLGYQNEASAEALLHAATAELGQKIASFSDEELAHELRILVQLGTAANPASFAVAVKGRIVAEVCAKRLFRQIKPDAPFPSKLAGLINEVELFIKEKNQGWILNYFQLLRNVGNNEAHATAAGVTLTDAAAVVVAAIRVAEFTTAADAQNSSPYPHRAR